ncbi:hypothetical protein EVAR_75934_1 [Eumeta japonica]|uniref:Craniofacial development protein 2 n=1 Tax=Eumeta variegata TaxID=151549 RepID=A0A4C1UWV4_EUMVA|nr:hypothetical protein EVAR_75934_1 [Eumeta japonica]
MCNQGTKKYTVGHKLFHPISNHLSSFLLNFCEQHSLVINSTWGRKSCKVTWRSGQRSSQIDHIITESYNTAKLEYIKGYWAKEVNSDHKIIETLRTPGKNNWTYKKKEEDGEK